jgi:hypothetical protein
MAARDVAAASRRLRRGSCRRPRGRHIVTAVRNAAAAMRGIRKADRPGRQEHESSKADRHSARKVSLGDLVMEATLLQLMEELLESIEQRDAGDPDAPAWEASARIQQLEEELIRRLSADDAQRVLAGASSGQRWLPADVLAGIA